MSVSKRLRFEILRRDNHQCRYCGATAPDVKLAVDHVVPIALGGGDEPSNLVTACVDCNAGKSATNPDATVVEDVSNRALQWADAMAVAATERRSNREERARAKDQFEIHWESYCPPGYQRRYHEELNPGWQGTIDQLLDAGLDIVDLVELVDVSMGSSNVKEKWRYFCGCCWKRVRQTQDRATEIVKSIEPEETELMDFLEDSSIYATEMYEWASQELWACYGIPIHFRCDCQYRDNDAGFCGRQECSSMLAGRILGMCGAWTHPDAEPTRSTDYQDRLSVDECDVNPSEVQYGTH